MSITSQNEEYNWIRGLGNAITHITNVVQSDARFGSVFSLLVNSHIRTTILRFPEDITVTFLHCVFVTCASQTPSRTEALISNS